MELGFLFSTCLIRINEYKKNYVNLLFYQVKLSTINTNINKDQQSQEAKPTAVQNLMDHFHLMNVYEAFSQSSAKTFKSCITVPITILFYFNNEFS